ncbi:MAG TPA: glycosyltransferase [Gemmatimonadales bacterium]|nr:glycosyltransferase [Gemmatimonadales bacterium]
MTDAAVTEYAALAGALALPLYSYLGYPALLKLLSLARPTARPAGRAGPERDLPFVSITIPVYNEAAVIADTLECVLGLDYPADRRQIVVVSDASTDGTDEIVARWASRGVELLRLPHRGGKTAAENAARARLVGDIVINTDASVRIHPQALRALVAALADRSVGVASGRDVSVDRLDGAANRGERTYVGYEMWVRDLETRVGGIVGASGCLYAIRAALHREAVPENLSRDFAAALIARRQGLRAVSVPEAVCYIPRSASLRQEYRRKVRTMARGLRTLWYMRALLNPARYGGFAWSLASHKLCRWLVPWSLAGAVAALVALAIGGESAWPAATLVAIGSVALIALVGWTWPDGRPLPRLVALPAYLVSGTIAALHAWVLALRGDRTAVWEPTRRGDRGEARAG